MTGRPAPGRRCSRAAGRGRPAARRPKAARSCPRKASRTGPSSSGTRCFPSDRLRPRARSERPCRGALRTYREFPRAGGPAFPAAPTRRTGGAVPPPSPPAVPRPRYPGPKAAPGRREDLRFRRRTPGRTRFLPPYVRGWRGPVRRLPAGLAGRRRSPGGSLRERAPSRRRSACRPASRRRACRWPPPTVRPCPPPSAPTPFSACGSRVGIRQKVHGGDLPVAARVEPRPGPDQVARRIHLQRKLRLRGFPRIADADRVAGGVVVGPGQDRVPADLVAPRTLPLCTSYRSVSRSR